MSDSKEHANCIFRIKVKGKDVVTLYGQDTEGAERDTEVDPEIWGSMIL
jgi:zona occludens toxin (predicted ATPase)